MMLRLCLPLLLAVFLSAQDQGIGGYQCLPQDGVAESSLSVLPDGRFRCKYTYSDGHSRTLEYPNPQHNTSFASDVATMEATDSEILQLPYDQRREAAAKKVLATRKASGDPKQMLDYIDGENDNAIAKSLNNIKGVGADEQVDAFNKEAIDHIGQDVAETSELAKAPSLKIDISADDLSSHLHNEKTIAAIITGVFTLDPYFFDDTRGGVPSYINDVGEISINKNLISTFTEDHSKDSFLGKSIDKMVSFFYHPLETLNAVNSVSTYNPINFMDGQVMGFMAYVSAAIHAAYMNVFTALFGVFAGLAGLYGAWTLGYNKFITFRDMVEKSTLLSKVNRKMRPASWHDDAKKHTQLPWDKLIPIIASVVFFLAPAYKQPVSLDGAMKYAIYKDPQQRDQAIEYHYSTPAQQLIRYTLQLGTGYGNMLNDYAMKAYMTLLNFKMGFVKDTLPRFVGKTAQDVASLEKQKAELAASATLYNTACQPYKSGSTYNIPIASQSAVTASTAIKPMNNIVVIGDAEGVGVASALGATGVKVNTMSSQGYNANSLVTIAQQAADSNPDMVIAVFGSSDIKPGGSFSNGGGTQEWRDNVTSAVLAITSPLKSAGAKVVCVPPALIGSDSFDNRANGIDIAMSAACDSVVRIPRLSANDVDAAQYVPNSSGYQKAAAEVAGATSGVKANRIDAASCKELENLIVSKSDELAKMATITSNAASSMKGYASNIKDKSFVAAHKGVGDYPEMTTDPTKVDPRWRKIRGRMDVWEYGYAGGEQGGYGATGGGPGSSNRSGFFKLPLSPEHPGWVGIGQISEYAKEQNGKMEAGTTNMTAANEDIRNLTLSGKMVAANWHLPLNTVVEVTSATGQKYRVRIVDRGPLAVYDSHGKRLVATRDNPWNYSSRFLDLTTSARKTLCFITDDRIPIKVIAYNAPAGYNPEQPNVLPDGTVKVNIGECKKQRQRLGLDLSNTFGPTVNTSTSVQSFDGVSGEESGTDYAYIEVDDSPLRSMKDFMQLIAFVNQNFGWVSAAMVPPSYEFFKYVNLFFVQDGAGQMNSYDATYTSALSSAYPSLINGGEMNFLLKTLKFVYADVLVSNSTWFMVPGFSGIYNAISNIMNKVMFKPDSSLELVPNERGSVVAKLGIAALVGTMVGSAGGFANMGDGVATTFGLLSMTAFLIGILGKSYLGMQIAMAIVSLVMSIALISIMVSIITVLLISTLIIIKIVLYFIEVSFFFLSAPVIGVVAAFGGNAGRYFSAFFRKLFILALVPLFIVVPSYLFIPISEFFRGLFGAMTKLLLQVMDMGYGSIHNGIDLIGGFKKVTMIAGMGGVINILSLFMTLIIIFIVFTKFRQWVMAFIGADDRAAGASNALGHLRDKIGKYIAPM